MLRILTSHTCQKLSGKVLDLAAWEWHKSIRFQEIENALAQQIRYDAYVIPKVEAISQVDAFVSIFLVVVRKSREYSKLYP